MGTQSPIKVLLMAGGPALAVALIMAVINMLGSDHDAIVAMEARQFAIEERLDKLEVDGENFHNDISKLIERMARVEEKVDALEGHLGRMEENQYRTEAKIDVLGQLLYEGMMAQQDGGGLN